MSKKIERKYLAHYIDANFGKETPNYVRLGADLAGFETRTAEYVHWWTFLGYFMEISEGVFSNVLGLRIKKAKKKKLEKWEREFWNANKDICIIKPKLTAEEREKKEKLNALLK